MINENEQQKALTELHDVIASKTRDEKATFINVLTNIAKESLNGMREARSQEAFEIQQQRLNTLLTWLCSHQIPIPEAIASQGKATTPLHRVHDLKKIGMELSWVSVGALLMTASTVLGIAFPPLLIPGLVIGAIIVAYSVMDVLIKIKHLRARSPHQQAPSGGATKPANKSEQQEQQSLKSIQHAMAFVGLALAVVALIFVMPMVVVPVAAVAATLTSSLLISLLTTGLTWYKTLQKNKNGTQVREDVTAQIEQDKAQLASQAARDLFLPEPPISSEVRILDELGGARTIRPLPSPQPLTQATRGQRHDVCKTEEEDGESEGLHPG